MSSFRKIFSMFLAICVLSCCSLHAFAVGDNLDNDQQIAIEQYTKDGHYVTKVNISAYRADQEAVQPANVEQGSISSADMELMEILGYDEKAILNMGEDEVENLLNNSATVTTTCSYYHYDEDTDRTEQITKEAYLSAKAVASARSGNNGSNSEISSDGYFKIITSAAYQYPSSVDDEKGWYVFSGTFTFWGNMPTYRMTDAASLYADEVMWSQTASDYWSRMTYYYYVDSVEDETSKTQTKTSSDRHLYSDGLYYEWKLPGDTLNGNIYVQTVTDIEIYVRGVARVSDYTNSRAFNLFTRFEHVYSTVGLQPTFSWTVGEKPGVSADVTATKKSNTYTSLCEIDYNPSLYLV